MAKRSAKIPALVKPGQNRKQPLVLHVDDDVASLKLASVVLEDAGISVLHAKHGVEALAKFVSRNPDLIIMDAIMPVMDGFEAIRKIREHKVGEHVPILMVTGLDDFESITHAYEAGATDFLTKPINFYSLPHRVHYMLRAKLTADELRSSQARLDHAQRLARLGNWDFNRRTQRMSWSQEFCRVLGLPDGMNGARWIDFLNRIEESDRHNVRRLAEQAAMECQAFSVEFSAKSQRDGSMRRIRLEAEPVVQDGNCRALIGTVQDITERSKAQKQIHDLAYYDLVTGLPNRAQLHERLRYTLKAAARNETRFALLFLDLDHFKQVNDTLGHDAGDELLKMVAQRLKTVVRETDLISNTDSDDNESETWHTVARLGGDEFVVLLGHINRAEDAARVAVRIAETIREPYDISVKTVSVTTTIGIAVFPTDGTDAEALMRNADVAMYHAKESGRNGYQFYSNNIHKRAEARFSLERDLKSAIENEELSLVYLPKINVGSGSVVGVEALVRWEHASKGDVSPGEFIPLAEETGLILPLGRWVLRSASKQMQTWIDHGMPKMCMSVNCSSLQFTLSDMVADISNAIQYSRLDPCLLEIELTESLFLEDIDTGISTLSRMKRLGVQVAIDDFGTGFSSLSYLKRLPVDKLKIDQSFVEELCTDSGDVAIVSAIITLSHNLQLSVVAEGVENLQQLRILEQFQCDEAQGYLFSHPLSADQFLPWLESYQQSDYRIAS
ncbi:MAG: EAL domain-containing protein [Granulosicoccus sp.]|nr:EAL domain-containing protein [Granulosicoccus sp.]